MSGDPSSQDNEQSLDGNWLRQERERHAISRPFLAEQLQVALGIVQKVETKNLAVPAEWMMMLARFGFRFQSSSESPSVAPATAAIAGEDLAPADEPSALGQQEGQESPSAESQRPVQTASEKSTTPEDNPPVTRQPPPTGSWLRAFRREHNLTLDQISQRLQIPVSTVGYYERKDRPLPSWWISTVQPLGQDTAQPDLVELIATYRLQFGRRAGQSAVEALAWIAHDLRTSSAEQDVSYEEVEAAIEALLSRRRARDGHAK